MGKFSRVGIGVKECREVGILRKSEGKGWECVKYSHNLETARSAT